MSGFDILKFVNKSIADVPPSGIRRFFDIVTEMKDAISLGVGEPDFTTPWNIREAAIYSIEKGETHYTSNWGTIELRRAISKFLALRYQTEYNPDNEILITVGASEGIDLALRVLTSPGDEILVPEPSYVSYMPGVVFAGGTPVGINTNARDSFRVTPDAIREKISPRTKAIILPYPNNPTGGVMSRDDLLAVANVIKDTNIVVISDEIYSELIYGGHAHCSFASLPDMWDRTITLNGFSKAFAMTGWRMGYACAPQPLAELMCKIHQFTMLCAPIMGQAAALEALNSGFENNFAEVEKMRVQYDRRRRLIVSRFNDMGLDCFEPLGAFYAFPSIKQTGFTSQEFCENLLSEQKIAVVPGTAFGPSGEGFVRVSYAYSIDSLREALSRVEKFISNKIK